MELERKLRERTDAILDRAADAVRRAHLEHYERAGSDDTRRGLHELFELVLRCVATRNVSPMIRFAERAAERRFAAGFDLREVQTAFNAVEEAVWEELLRRARPRELPEGLGLVGTVIGLGKDARARRYVALAARVHVPSLDPRALFSGTDGV